MRDLSCLFQKKIFKNFQYVRISNYNIHDANFAIFHHQQIKTKKIEQNDSDDNLLWRSIFIYVREFVNEDFFFEKPKLQIVKKKSN